MESTGRRRNAAAACRRWTALRTGFRVTSRRRADKGIPRLDGIAGGIVFDFDPNRVFQYFVLMLDSERVLIAVALLDDDGLISDAHAHATLLLIPDGVMVRVRVKAVNGAFRAESFEDDEVRGCHQHFDGVDAIFVAGVFGNERERQTLRSRHEEFAGVVRVHEGYCGVDGNGYGHVVGFLLTFDTRGL